MSRKDVKARPGTVTHRTAAQCLGTVRPGFLGMHVCACGRQWYVFAPGWARRWGTDRVYHDGKPVGSPTFYGELTQLVRKHRRAEVKAAGPQPELFP